jgi:hypothetical protein
VYPSFGIRDNESEIENMDRRLAEAARSLSELVAIFPPEHLGDLVDLTIGALASLIRADQLKYQDEDRIGKELPPEYYSKLSERVRRMSSGTLPPHGRWLSGYYFNSGLLRLGAAREMTQKLLAYLDKGKPHVGSNIAQVTVDDVYQEYCSIKHHLRSLRMGRRVTFAQAVQSLDELVRVLSERREELSDPKTKFPPWSKSR